MLFELRNGTPEVTPDWVPVRDQYLSGKVRDAWESAQSRRGQCLLATANDFLLNLEIARACSAHRTYMALSRTAMRRFPDNPFVQFYHARVLLTLSRQTEGLQFLHDREQTLGKTHRVLWATALANVYASAGFAASCARWLKEVDGEAEMESPLALYTQSCALESLQRWDEAIDLATRCVQAAPEWTRARGYLINCLLARGRITDAEREIAEVARRGQEDATAEISAAMLPLSRGRFDEARDGLENLLARWPQADFRFWIRRTLCVLLVELGQYDAARQVIDGEEDKFRLPPIPAQPTGNHRFIPLPLIAQNRNQCVPTSVAMAVYPQGQTFDPDQMFREMHGREGTTLWRMRQWSENHGFRVVPIRLEREAIVAMLDADVPLIGALERPFNSHVDVVCGYNDDLETLYIRDPSHWSLIAWPWELAAERYNMHSGLLAVIDRGRTEVIDTAETFRSAECTALLDLAEAISNGERTDAESAYEAISDDSAASWMRDSHAVNVAISPLRFRQRMKVISEDPDANLVARFRAVMSLGADETAPVIEKILNEDDGRSFGVGATRYLRLIRLMNDGQWESANKLIDQLLQRGCGVALFWELKSDILAELGQHKACRQALDRAIELEPLQLSTRVKALQRDANKLTMDEYVREFEQLLAEDPDDKRLLISRAQLLRDGPDGETFEAAAKDVLHWFPRYPDVYFDLLHWYQFQGRQDLSDALLETAKRLLPDVFGTAESDAPDDADTETENETLPQDKTQLLDLIWNAGDPRRDQALEHVLAMQHEGQLQWHEVVRLSVCRLLLPDSREGELNDPEAVLPKDPPGARHWFADQLLDLLTDFDPDLGVAQTTDRWLQQVVPNYGDYPDLWFKRVLLLEKMRQMERALEELRELLKRYPATSSARYRMGVVKLQQQDYSSAQQHFEKALQVNPGLYGAMDGLRDVAEMLGDEENVLRCTRMLRRKMPYAVGYLRDELLSVVKLQSVDAALTLLDGQADRFPSRRVTVLRARLHLADDDYESADSLLAGIELSAEDDDDSFEECLQVKLHLASLTAEERQIESLCESGLQRWPNSTRLKELLADAVTKTNPAKAEQLLRELLHGGEPGPETALQYMTSVCSPHNGQTPTRGQTPAGRQTPVGGRTPDRAARAVIMEAPEDRRVGLVELFAGVMTEPGVLQFNESFLEWGLEQFPDSDVLRWRLAMHYNLSGQEKHAVKLARELHQRNPDNLEALRTLGRCLIDTDAKKALPLLEKVCQQNRSAEYLFDLARCHQVAGQVDRAKQIHWEILGHNPYHSASWTNLFLFGGARDRLWPLLLPMLERGCGAEDQYFLVAAVQLALELGERLPRSWYPLAIQRWSMLQIQPGFRDESRRLRKALRVWQARRPADVDGQTPLPRDVIESLVARFWWPKQAWVAPQES